VERERCNSIDANAIRAYACASFTIKTDPWLTKWQGTLFAAVAVILLCCRMVLNLKEYKPRTQSTISMSISVMTTTNAFPLSATHDWEGHQIARASVTEHDINSGMWNVEQS
jgi:hypothetical protein